MQNKGGRPATGSVKWKRNAKTRAMQWHARVTFPDKSRRWVDLDPAIPEHDEAAARTCAKETSDEVRGGNYAATKRETVSEYAKRWFAERDARGLTSVPSDKSRFLRHVEPVIGPLDMRAVRRPDIERIVDDLDRKVLLPHDHDDHIAWMTARNTWGVLTKMFDDATHAKRRDLRVRDDDPTDGVRGPDRGARKAKQYLYPSEFLKLVSCPDVPLRWRRLYAVAVYTFARAGELEALTWDDVDREHGVIHISKAVDRHTGKVKATKTGETRRIPIEPAVSGLLEALHEGRDKVRDGAGPVVWLAPDQTRAKALRRHLRLAGVDRPELFVTDRARKQLTFHDLRATGITWAAVRGDEALRIKQRAGHSSFSTTEIYIREAENLRAGFGEPFPPLPPELIETSEGVSAPVSAFGSPRSRNEPDSSAPWRREGDSKPTEKTTNGAEVSREADAPAVAPETKPDEEQQPKPESPRVALVEALTRAARDAALVGDAGALKVATEALAKLVVTAGGGEVVDIQTEREKRSR